MGYAGGVKPSPTYRSLKDHTEVVQVDYDPELVSFDSLLSLFWASHNPAARLFGRQYMSLILTADDAQQTAAELGKEQAEARYGKVHTEIKHLSEFYLAEDYHQKYYLTRVPTLLRELRERYPTFAQFVDSLQVARVNGYVAGYGTSAMLGAEIDELPLSAEAKRRLQDIVLAHS